MRLFATLAAAALLSFAAPASANVITFETATAGPGFTGPVTEDGFTYSLGALFLYVTSFGNPGQDMEGDTSLGGGVLEIRKADGGLFTFESVDFAAWDASGTGTQDLIVGAVRDGFFLVFDSFNEFNTANSPYTNWTTEHAMAMAGLPMDTLIIILGGGSDPTAYHAAIDNVVLSPVPEPATLMLLGTGLMIFSLRRSSTAKRRL